MRDEAERMATQICRQLYAMVQKKKPVDEIRAMRDAPGQRTFTDEYSFSRAPRPGKPITAEERAAWELVNRNG